MLNTYGLRSVNRETFNQQYHGALQYPRELRNIVVTALRVNNPALNILGYIPGISFFSGCVRMGIGTGIIGLTLAIGDRKASRGAIIGRFYDEALLTGLAQIARGALEALVPLGRSINAGLDSIVTPFNFFKEFEESYDCGACMTGIEMGHVRPHNDVQYSLPFQLLHLA